MVTHPVYFRTQTSRAKVFSSQQQRCSARLRPRFRLGIPKRGKEDAHLLFLTPPCPAGASSSDLLGTNPDSAVDLLCDTANYLTSLCLFLHLKCN